MTAIGTIGRPATGRVVREDRLPRWWPLAVIVYGYPLWWLLGLTAVVPMLMAVAMAFQLWRTKPIVLPRGFGFWALFLLWVLLGVLTLWVDAPGAVPGGGPGRLVPYAYRLAWYLTVTIVLLWLANSSRRAIPFSKVASIFAWMFVITAFGGLLGVMAPELELRSALEMALPRGVRSNSFVQALVHPGVADVQAVLGRPEARPKAPFPYANTWGAVLALSLPFFLVAWIKEGTRRHRIAAPFVLIVAAVPTVYSLNRGLWGCLVLGLVFLAVVQGWRGRPAHLLALLIVVVVGSVAVVASPLGTMVGERFANQHSNDRRGDLLTKTVVAAAEGSPVVGFGSTRDVQGSFASIAGGGTPACPACEVPPLGTQGHLWLVTFSQGLVGAALFLMFFGPALLGTLRCRTPAETVATALLLFFALQLFVYDTLGMPLLMIMAAIGLSWRDQSRRRDSDTVVIPVVTMRELAERVWVHRRWWVAGVAVGAIAGLGLAAVQAPRFAATNSILLAAPPSYLAVSGSNVKPPRETTVDTEAALVMAERTMTGALGSEDTVAASRLRDEVRVTASPNTRLIHIRVEEESATAAESMAARVASAYLETRKEYLAQRRNQYLLKLRERQQELAAIGGPSGRYLSEPQRQELAQLNRAIGDIVLTPTQAGETMRAGAGVEISKPYSLAVASGIAVGLLVGALATVLGTVYRRRPRREYAAWTVA